MAANPSSEDNSVAYKNYHFGNIPLLIDPILDRVFRYLKGKDLKSCRAVCSKWKDVSHRYILKESRIVFDFSNETRMQSGGAVIRPMWREFYSTIPEKTRLTSIRLQGVIPIRSKLFSIFKKERSKFVTDLQLYNVKVPYSELGYLFEPSVKKLKIGYPFTASLPEKEIVALHRLIALEQLELENCDVVVIEKPGIYPTELQELSLTNVSFYDDARDYRDLNNMIGPKLRKLKIDDEKASTHYSLSLDLFTNLTAVHLVRCEIRVPMTNNDDLFIPHHHRIPILENIVELIIVNVKFIVRSGQRLASYCINTLAGSKLKKLSAKFDASDYNEASRLSISLNNIISATHICLENVSLILHDLTTQIVPVVLELRDVSIFLRGSTFVNENTNGEWLINPHVSFGQMKKLLICGGAVKLDLSGVVKLDTLELINPKIINWGASKWKIKKMILKKFEIFERNKMKVKNLEIQDFILDVDFLPESVESLIVGWYARVKNRRPDNHQNLKDLNLCHRDYSFLSNFFNCDNLTKIEFSSVTENIILDVKAIPVTVKTIIFTRLSNIKLVGLRESDNKFPLENLILKSKLKVPNSYYYVMEAVLLKFNPQNLSVSTTIREEDAELVTDMLIWNGCKRVVVGQYSWTGTTHIYDKDYYENDFSSESSCSSKDSDDDYPMRKYLGKHRETNSKYLIFEGKYSRGKSINKYEFQKYFKL